MEIWKISTRARAVFSEHKAAFLPSSSLLEHHSLGLVCLKLIHWETAGEKESVLRTFSVAGQILHFFLLH